MTERELERIKAEWFDRGWRWGLGVGLGIAMLAAIISVISEAI